MVSVPLLVLEIYELAVYQQHPPCHCLHCVHCRHVLFHHLECCLNMYYSRFILYISIIFSFEIFNLGYSYHSFHSFRRISFSYSNYCEWTVSVPCLVLEIYGLAVYQCRRHRPCHHLHCDHCRHVLFHHLDHCSQYGDLMY